MHIFLQRVLIRPEILAFPTKSTKHKSILGPFGLSVQVFCCWCRKSEPYVVSRMLAFPLILINSKFFFGNRENRQNSVKCFTIPDITCFNWFVCSSVAVHRRPVRWVEVGLNEMARYAADLMPFSVKMRENLFWNLLKTCENQNATPTNSAVVNRVRFSWENTNNTQSKP